MTKYSAVRGTRDIFGEEIEKINYLEKKAQEIFSTYGYSEIRLPTFEQVELFTRSIGESTDIVEKEMYVFNDRKGRKLALRPEGTAGIVRAYIENNFSGKPRANKLFYRGPMFRYERPQKGRYREFYQIGSEYFENPLSLADAEIILLAQRILTNIGIEKVELLINSLGCKNCRPAYRQALLTYFKEKTSELCADCQQRLEKNPLRVLDCKIDGGQIANAPKTTDFLCADCQKHFSDLKQLLDQEKCAYQVDSKLVRGLDYYTRTIFEFKLAGLGAQDTLAAGGRYDGLVEEMGGQPTSAVGFALGVERVTEAIPLAFIEEKKKTTVFVVNFGEQVMAEAFQLLQSLRRNGVSAEIGINSKSMKSQLRTANDLGVRYAVIFGENELIRRKLTIKDMKTQEQIEIENNEAVNYFVHQITKN